MLLNAVWWCEFGIGTAVAIVVDEADASRERAVLGNGALTAGGIFGKLPETGLQTQVSIFLDDFSAHKH